MQTIETLDPQAFKVVSLKEFVQNCLSNDILSLALGMLPALSLETGPFIAGGSLVRAHLGKQDYSDIDIFCVSTEQFQATISAIEAIGAYVDTFENAASMGEKGDTSLANYTLDGVKLQVIDIETRAVPGSSTRQVLMSFDITAAMVATDGRDVVLHEEAEKSLNQREVFLNKSEYRAKLLEFRPHLDKDDIRVEKYRALLGETTIGPGINFKKYLDKGPESC